MGQFTVCILKDEPLAKATGESDEWLYEGDSAMEAAKICDRTLKDAKYKGRTMRVYNFSLWGGGVKDHLI